MTSPSVYGDNLLIAAYHRDSTRFSGSYYTNCNAPIRWCSATVYNTSGVTSHAVGLIDKAFVLNGGSPTCSDFIPSTCGWYIWKAQL